MGRRQHPLPFAGLLHKQALAPSRQQKRHLPACAPNFASASILLYFCTAAGIENEDEQLLLEDGLYSLILYHQVPQG